MSGPWIAVVITQWIAIVVLAVMVLGFMRRHAAVLERAEQFLPLDLPLKISGLSVGERPEQFDALDDAGRLVAVDPAATPAIFLFLSSGCAPCRGIAEELAASDDRRIDPHVPLWVIVDQRGPWIPASRTGVAILEQVGGSASAAFRSNASPQAFLIDPGGAVAATTVPATVEDLARLARQLSLREVTTE